MKKPVKIVFNDLLKKIIAFYTNEEMEVTLFKILGTGGTIVSLIGAVQSLYTTSDYMGSIINLLAAIASVSLMWFVHTTQKYVIGYLITSVSVFMILFAWLFLEFGGMNGSMPYFFVFGIVFTTMMYKGTLLYIMEVVQVAFYGMICIMSYMYPDMVKQFETPEKMFGDQLAGILLSSVGLGILFLIYIAEYRKQQNIALESSKAKSVLLANISHEIRTPINMLMGMNEMILRETESAQITEYSQNIDNAGRQLLFMVNQFLDLSRIDMGKEVLFEEDFNLVQLIQSLDAFFKKEAQKRGLDFVLDLDRKLPAFYSGDSQKLSQILSNLLTNAVKYTPKGTIVFTVQDLGVNSEGRRIHFEVSDTGMGISEEDMKKIFESFERADIIRQRSIEGTGLGLSISNKLANLMGSEIKVQSKLGVGSVFWLDLTLKEGEQTETEEDTDASFIAPEAKILVVDDNNMNLMVVKALLKRTLIGIDIAESAKACYEKCAHSAYDAVLMDYMMPEIDGIEAMEHLREMPGYKRTPVIVLTADATPGKREMFFQKGFDDYILKPIDSRLLEKILIRHLPERLVTLVNSESQAELTEEMKLTFTELLKQYDISFEMGMKHLSGDVLQLARVSGFFVKTAEENMRKLSSFVEAGDFENAAIIIHSVKGNSGNVGGEDLYYSARRLEKRAKEGDAEYVQYALPFFFMKWKRVLKGLNLFLEEFEKVKPGIVHEGKEKEELGEKEMLTGLLEALSLGNQSPALKYVDELAALKGEDETLRQIRECIRNIEFEKAEELIRQRLL